MPFEPQTAKPASPRILFVKRYHFSRFSGGAEEQCWLLATELARRGWDVHYASEMNNLPDPPIMDGVRLHSLPENPPHIAGNRAAVRALMRELYPQVIYNRSFDIYTRDAMLEAPAGSVTIWASAMSGDGFIWPRLRQMQKVTPLPQFLKRLPIHFSIFAAAKKAVHRASIILVQRKDQVENFRRHEMKALRFRNVQPSVPESELQKHDGVPMVLWAASLKDWKRPEKFIELASRCRDLDADFVMIGAAQEARYKDLLDSAKKEISRLRWDGHIPIPRVREYFARTHIFVNTSIELEGFPNSFIHAWMYGIPVVSLGVDPEHLLSKSGLGAVTTSVEDLEQVIRRLLAYPEERREIGARARAFALAEFDLQRNVNRLEEMIAEHGITPPRR